MRQRPAATVNARTWALHAMVVLAALPIALGVGCSPTDPERCDQMDAVIEAKAAQLPGFCELDIDCQLVVVNQGLIVAANSSRPDPELDDIQRRRRELCGEFSTDGRQFAALCVNNQCQARTDEDLPDVGVPDTGPDTGECDCETNRDCGPRVRCVEGCCVPICALACGKIADNCGVETIVELGLGTTVDNCIARCDAALETDGPELPVCLADENRCDRLDRCLP